MRKNRKMPKKMSVVAGLSVKIGAVMVMLFAWGILYVLATSSCTQLSTTIREKERLLAKLEDEQKRQSAAWDRMKTNESLETALLRHGISMRTPNAATQVVRMDASGRPYPGQISVARARERSKAAQTAKYTTARNPAAGVATNRKRR